MCSSWQKGFTHLGTKHVQVSASWWPPILGGVSQYWEFTNNLGQYWGNTKKSPAKSLTFSVSSRYTSKIPPRKTQFHPKGTVRTVHYIHVCLTFVPTSRGVCPLSLNSLAFFTPIIGDLGRFSITVQEQLCTIIFFNEIKIFQQFWGSP